MIKKDVCIFCKNRNCNTTVNFMLATGLPTLPSPFSRLACFRDGFPAHGRCVEKKLQSNARKRARKARKHAKAG